MPATPPECGDFGPSASWEILKRRAEILKQIRTFFDERGFLEVETPLLSRDTVVDRHLEPLRLEGDVLRRVDQRPWWLQTSPEFCMKRLLCAGATAIYQITRAFRAGEAGQMHNPEFTMVEWYRVGDGMIEGIDLLDALVQRVLGGEPAQRIRYADAFQQFTGVDAHRATIEDLSAACRRLEVVTPAAPADADRDFWLDVLFAERVQQELGRVRPTIIFDYPASQAALAVVRDDDPPVAERFELFVRGVELANGYHELTDAKQLAERAAAANRQRTAADKTELPTLSRLADAMRVGLPPSAGTALGLDRLVLVAVGARSLDQVMTFPIDRA